MGEQLYLDSNIKYCDLKDFLKAQFVIFRCQNMWKYLKKRVHRKRETTLLWALKKVALFYTTYLSNVFAVLLEDELVFALWVLF